MAPARRGLRSAESLLSGGSSARDHSHSLSLSLTLPLSPRRRPVATLFLSSSSPRRRLAPDHLCTLFFSHPQPGGQERFFICRRGAAGEMALDLCAGDRSACRPQESQPLPALPPACPQEPPPPPPLPHVLRRRNTRSRQIWSPRPSSCRRFRPWSPSCVLRRRRSGCGAKPVEPDEDAVGDA